MDIKKLRAERNLTQVQLARLIGVSSQAVKLWEWQDATPNEKNMKKLEELQSGQRIKQVD
jgi:DNA-binding transcriptional regulator YiaG